MPKKLELKNLKIQSFVTTLNDKQSAELKGGKLWESCPSCPAECLTNECTEVQDCSNGSYSGFFC